MQYKDTNELIKNKEVHSIIWGFEWKLSPVVLHFKAKINAIKENKEKLFSNRFFKYFACQQTDSPAS